MIKAWIVSVVLMCLSGCITISRASEIKYVLPKSQPLFSGMIVVCDQPQVVKVIGGKNELKECENGKCLCHWECRDGFNTSERIEDGNKVLYPVSCKDAQFTGVYKWSTITPNFLQAN